MANSNCLEGVACPECGQEDHFQITGMATFDVTDDGSEAVGDHVWDGDSPCTCMECQHTAKLRDFTTENWTEEKRLWQIQQVE